MFDVRLRTFVKMETFSESTPSSDQSHTKSPIECVISCIRAYTHVHSHTQTPKGVPIVAQSPPLEFERKCCMRTVEGYGKALLKIFESGMLLICHYVVQQCRSRSCCCRAVCCRLGWQLIEKHRLPSWNRPDSISEFVPRRKTYPSLLFNRNRHLSCIWPPPNTQRTPNV